MHRFYHKILLILLLGLSACSTITTEIVKEDGSMITVRSKGDALVKFGDVTVDNRGRPGIVEQFISAVILRPKVAE